jgi:glycerol-3-phosphate dehydrogenase
MPKRRPSPPPSPRSAFDRQTGLNRLTAESWDVVVVGGGITGCGVALDAAARGLRVALVEAEDFASGTSSKSSKLVHGGLRYLQHREYGLVYESLAERQRLLSNAPHLVRPLPFLIPLFGRDGVVAAGTAKAYSTALWLYDLTGGLRIGQRHHRVGAATALRHVPGLRVDRLVAGFVYWDAQADDARLTLAVARTAAALGAVVVNRAPVEGLLHGDRGRVAGVRLAGGGEVRAGVVINAAGVWSTEVSGLGGAGGGVHLRPAKGVHLTVPADRLPCDQAVVLPVPGGRGSVFVVPWDAAGARPNGGAGRFTYVGTTDTDYDGSLRRPMCTGADIDTLLATVNAWTSAALTPADVTGTWAGLRPLLDAAPGGTTADLSRRHLVEVSAAGLVTVTGGKLTTYRRMAVDAVDKAMEALGRDAGSSPTAHLALVGAPVGPTVAPRGGVLGVPSLRAHLTRRYGTEAPAVADLADADPDLARPLVAGLPYLRAEAVWAVRAEMATTLEDVLARRTRAWLLDRGAAVAAAADVAGVIAPELGWDEERVRAEMAAVAAHAEADDEAQADRPIQDPEADTQAVQARP